MIASIISEKFILSSSLTSSLTSQLNYQKSQQELHLSAIRQQHHLFCQQNYYSIAARTSDNKNKSKVIIIPR